METKMNQYQEFMELVINERLYFVKPYPKNDDYFHIMRDGEFVCKMNFRSSNLIRDTLEGIRKYLLIKTTDSYDKVKGFVTRHAEEVEQNEQADEEEETAGA